MYKIYRYVVSFLQYESVFAFGIACWIGITFIIGHLVGWDETVPMEWIKTYLFLYACITLKGLVILLWKIFQEVTTQRSKIQSKLGSAIKKYRGDPSANNILDIANVVRYALDWGGIRWVNKTLKSLDGGLKIAWKIRSEGESLGTMTVINLIDGYRGIFQIKL